MDTYSPRAIVRCTSDRACVSISSVLNTLPTPCRAIRTSSLAAALALIVSPSVLAAIRSRDTHAVDMIPLGHVREDHLIALLQPGPYLHALHAAAPQLHRG